MNKENCALKLVDEINHLLITYYWTFKYSRKSGLVWGSASTVYRLEESVQFSCEGGHVYYYPY